MAAISVNEQTTSDHDFDLGIVGFRYSDLFDAVKLKELAEKFYDDLAGKDALLHSSLTKYIAAHGHGFEKRVESKILTDAAPYLSDFVARMFGITRERTELENEILVQNPIWKYKFFVQRRAIKQFGKDAVDTIRSAELNQALNELRFKSFDETLIHDDELAIASITARLLDAEESLTKETERTEEVQQTINKLNKAIDDLKDKTFGRVFTDLVLKIDETGDLLIVKAALTLIEAWSANEFNKREKRWAAFKVPHPLDYQNLVHLIHPEPKLHNIIRGRASEMPPPRRLQTDRRPRHDA